MQRREKKEGMMAEINITPFTDVVLVLLIIFMIITPMVVKNGIQVQVPKAGTGRPEQGKFCTISIDARENIFIDEQKVALEKLRQLVEPRVGINPEVVVKINGDKRIKYAVVMQVLDATRAAGAARYMLVTERTEPGIIGGTDGETETGQP